MDAALEFGTTGPVPTTDVPTLAELAGATFAPVLAGEDMTARPPIHLLFAGDRGLRDGDWELVSFRSQPWELYNIANDRAELHNVAAAHPEMVKRMVKRWLSRLS